jgi:hypothetical protein
MKGTGEVADFLLETALMIYAILHYDMKRLLRDTSRALMADSEERRQVTLQLADPAKTRLQKVARIKPCSRGGKRRPGRKSSG